MSTQSPASSRWSSPLFAAAFASGLSVVLVLLLAFAWMRSGSVSVLSAMVDSVMDIVISASNVLVIRYAFQPADKDHRFGHGKMEGVAALAQAAFICGSGLFVGLEAIDRLTKPDPITDHMFAIAVLVVVSILTLGLTYIQHKAAKASGSLAIEADRAHFVGDIAVNIGVIITLLLDAWLQIRWLDPVIAFGVVGWLVMTAFGIGRKAMDMLLDREIGDPDRAAIKTIIRDTNGVLDLHDLRVTRSGPRYMIAFDIELAPEQTLRAAHDIARSVEDRLLAVYPDAHIMIHKDPAGDIHDSRHGS